MRLRELREQDATLMLEWMHDKEVVQNLQTNFRNKTIGDCYEFIHNSSKEKCGSVHMAVVDEKDEYMGTVSLKNVNNGMAEFAITIRKCAMGKGYSKYAMREIIKFGFEKLNLNQIYWCVSPDNIRAIKFYEKNGYKRIGTPSEDILGYTSEQVANYQWYEIVNCSCEIQ